MRRGKKKLMIRADKNKIENRKTIEKFNKINSWFFEMINKIGNRETDS